MKIAVAQEGQSYFEGRACLLQWPRGGGKRETLEVPDDQAEWSARMRANFQRGRLVEVKAHHVPRGTHASAVAGTTYKELQAEAKALGIPHVGVKRAKLEAAIAAANQGGTGKPADEPEAAASGEAGTPPSTDQ